MADAATVLNIGLVDIVRRYGARAQPMLLDALATAEETRSGPLLQRVFDVCAGLAAGIEALYGRVRVAAEQLCEPTRVVTGTRLSNGYERCVKDAVATTVQKINLPNLTALHAALPGAFILEVAQLGSAPGGTPGT